MLLLKIPHDGLKIRLHEIFLRCPVSFWSFSESVSERKNYQQFIAFHISVVLIHITDYKINR
jgi:hypothetical protein